jgi:RNA polymerase sigma-70 factor (ECF subfamily)
MTKRVQQNETSDADIITAYKAGTGDLSELYNRYANLVFGSCFKYFKNKPDADDAVSEIFSLISKKLKTHEVESFKSWLYTVTRNYCIEVLRKNNRLRDKISAAESMYNDTIFHPDEVEDVALIAKLGKCIDALPDKQREVIDLFYFKKINYKDISVKMDISWDKVRSFMQNGRRNLKNCIEK